MKIVHWIFGVTLVLVACCFVSLPIVSIFQPPGTLIFCLGIGQLIGYIALIPGLVIAILGKPMERPLGPLVG